MSGRLENDSFKLLELKLNLEGNMADKIQNAYETSKNIYDDVLTQRNIFSKLYIKLFWSGTDDNDIARKVLSYVPDDFSGKLLDVPVGTAVFTENKWSSLKNAHITCIDYSMDMLEQARKRLGSHAHIKCIQGDVGNLQMENESVDTVVSMNGFHAFLDKQKAFHEIWRVLKPGGNFIACFYIRGKSQRTDWLAGIREGTVIAALLVGFIARLIGKKLAFLKDMIFPESVSAENKNEAKEQTAGTTGYTPEFVKKKEEIMTNSLLYDLVNQMYLNTDRQDEAPKDKIFEAECQVVRNLAKKGNCVIVGRCADYVLRNSGNCLKVFFSAPLMSRIRRVAQRQNISDGEAKATVQKNEKLRADNYRYYTRRMWGAAGNFDLSLNTDLGEEYIENCIRSAMKL